MISTSLLVRTGIATAFLAGALTTHAAFPLTVYDGNNQSGTSGGCWKNTPYIGNSIPGNLNNKINSIKLLAGFGVVIGNNTNGVWGSRFYRAHLQDRNINLSGTFKNKVSFIRVVKLDTGVQKKGHAGGDTDVGAAVGASWYYNWGSGASDKDGLEYIPMRWGGGSASNIESLATTLQRQKASQLLAFNEPDNSNQSNLTVSKALDRYEVLLKSGLRMGSPVVEQDNYNTWLDDFMTEASSRGFRIDFIALHWYDWGSQSNNSTGNQIKNRMVSKVLNARNLLGSNMSVWMTEFNANRNRNSQQDHANFISSAVSYINGQSWFERYSYFRAGGGVFGSANSLTTSGKAYRDAPDNWSDWREVNNKGWN